MATYKRLDVAFESGEGAWLIDRQGKTLPGCAEAALPCAAWGMPIRGSPKSLPGRRGGWFILPIFTEYPCRRNWPGVLAGISGMDRVFFCNSGG